MVRHQLPLPGPRTGARPGVPLRVERATAAQVREALARARHPSGGDRAAAFLRLAKRTDGSDTIIDAILPAYVDWLTDLAAPGATEIQLDEPALVLDLSPAEVDGCAARLGPRAVPAAS